jgi:hypothetical protein
LAENPRKEGIKTSEKWFIQEIADFGNKPGFGGNNRQNRRVFQLLGR